MDRVGSGEKHLEDCTVAKWPSSYMYRSGAWVWSRIEENESLSEFYGKVGHSIGGYIGMEICKRFQKKVISFVGLYPFLTLNKNAMKQSAIGYVARSSLLSKGVSLFASFIGSLQASVTRSIVKRFLGSSWSATAIDAGCSHLLQYHTMRNVLFMAKTEFLKLHEEPDWNFIRAKQDQIAFLFGVDDHWGPLTHLEEISRHAPGVALSIEKEGHTHGYCCREAGSFWVADYVANLIKNRCSLEIADDIQLSYLDEVIYEYDA
ncbi:lipid droplet-associated hydrolase [Hordeum vulgare]|nr:lipid droplet-associated hydrolase [Hordeum vulgare]